MRTAPAFIVVLSFAACAPKEPVDLGGQCPSESQEACAVGKLAVCNRGKWTETMTCTGPRACYRMPTRTGSAPVCDEGRGRVGTACKPWGQIICGEDNHAQLVCEKGLWRMKANCPKACGWNESGNFCE